jgi:hypothetical protein
LRASDLFSVMGCVVDDDPILSCRHTPERDAEREPEPRLE